MKPEHVHEAAAILWRNWQESTRIDELPSQCRPRLALAWIANELSRFSDGLQAGDVVTTGTCITPIPIAAGDRLLADFGAFGVVEATMTNA